MAVEYKGFKISELSSISHIDDKDLFLVSDCENGKFYTKKMTSRDLMNYIGQNSVVIGKISNSQTMTNKIDARIKNDLKDPQISSTILKPIISSEVMTELKSPQVSSALAPVISTQVSSIVEDLFQVLSCGGAE